MTNNAKEINEVFGGVFFSHNDVKSFLLVVGFSFFLFLFILFGFVCFLPSRSFVDIYGFCFVFYRILEYVRYVSLHLYAFAFLMLLFLLFFFFGCFVMFLFVCLLIILFHYYSLDACLFSSERMKRCSGLAGGQSGDKLELGGRETKIRIYPIREKKTIFNNIKMLMRKMNVINHYFENLARNFYEHSTKLWTRKINFNLLRK